MGPNWINVPSTQSAKERQVDSRNQPDPRKASSKSHRRRITLRPKGSSAWQRSSPEGDEEPSNEGDATRPTRVDCTETRAR